METKNIILLTAILSLILTGCGSQPQTNENSINTMNPFIGGTVGLNAYLLEGLPPPFIQDAGQSPFSMAVVLENQGESDVGVAPNNYFKVRLEGINPAQWNVQNPVQDLSSVPLRGARRNYDGTVLPGETIPVSFESMNYMPNIRGNTEFILRAQVCYDYSNIATTKVCIKDDVLENIQDSTMCKLAGEKFPQNSGGPMHITSVVQNPLAANKIQVNFVVEHVGFGDFYGPGVPDETCDPSISNFNKHKVKVIVHDSPDDGFSIGCPRFGGLNVNQGTITLYQGLPQTISCVMTRDSQSSGRVFQDLLEIETQYRYGQFIETPIIVQDVSFEPI
ncbi:hypothetical protein ACFL1B_04115 [Nanoarchaeota archaeon]